NLSLSGEGVPPEMKLSTRGRDARIKQSARCRTSRTASGSGRGCAMAGAEVASRPAAARKMVERFIGRLRRRGTGREKPTPALARPQSGDKRLFGRFQHLPGAPARGDTALELGTEMADEALDRPGGGVAQRADRVPLD